MSDCIPESDTSKQTPLPLHEVLDRAQWIISSIEYDRELLKKNPPVIPDYIPIHLPGIVIEVPTRKGRARLTVRETPDSGVCMALIDKPKSVLSLLGLPEQSSVMNTGVENAVIGLANLLIGSPGEQILNAVGGPMMMVGKGAKNWANLPRKFSNMADKMERAEISDAGARMRSLTESWRNTLEGILEHPELYEAYPYLKDIAIQWKKGTGGNFRSVYLDPLAEYGAKPARIEIGLDNEDKLGVLLHEIQHAIQEREGFARGGSPSEFQSAKNMVNLFSC